MRLLSITLGFLAWITCQTPSDYTTLREAMVAQQIAARGVTDENILRAMRTVPRHLFVPPTLRFKAYTDQPLPIGQGQTISQPYIVAYMTELLRVDSTHKVLEIGTGSGYQAAILSLLVKKVYTIEIVPELGHNAAQRLQDLDYTNVSVKIGDGYQGWPEVAPFDRIIVTAAPEEIPPELVKQLKPGGRMVVPTGPQWWGQDLLIVDKQADGTVKITKTIPVRFVPMVHE